MMTTGTVKKEPSPLSPVTKYDMIIYYKKGRTDIWENTRSHFLMQRIMTRILL